MKRRGFLGKIVGLLGLAALPVRSVITTESAEPELIELKKATITELPNGWVAKCSYRRFRKSD